jgi:hypothetical protein
MKNSMSATPSSVTPPGAPGAKAFWSRSSKDGIGTAYHTSCRLWFTLCQGVISEIYCPTVDTPNSRTALIEEDQLDGFHILTAFLGINQNISETGPPLWFETMVFRASADGNLGVEIKYETLRYSKIADALAGHCVICEKVKYGEIGEKTSLRSAGSSPTDS